MSSQNKKISKKKKTRPTICLFVEHSCPAMSHSLYVIRPPLNLSNYDQMIDSDGFMTASKYISPVLTFPDKNSFLTSSASVSLGSKIYFLGGMHDRFQGPPSVKRRLALQVQVFDTDHPDQGMRSVAPMNAPKESPCVFVADGMIYALGAALGNRPRIRPGTKSTGFFERYDPSSDHWQVLPDPPLSFYEWGGALFYDRATVVGRRVFIGTLSYVVFNLDIQDWDPRPPTELAARFPYGARFVPDTASLYHLCGPGSWKAGTFVFDEGRFGDPLRVVKRGPLATTAELLKSECLVPGKEQVMAAESDLDENKYFITDGCYFPWRELFHMGGRVFCYVVTAQLANYDGRTHQEPNSRAVWIKFFEEVPAHNDNSNAHDKPQFRSLASFCYKINTNFFNKSYFIRCSVLGTVPDSWRNAPLKEKQESNLKHSKEESEVFHLQMCSTVQDQDLVMKSGRQEYKAEQSCDDLENAENRETGDYKLLAVEEENNRLAAELAKKNELLKAYEALLAKSGLMVEV